MDWKQEYQEKLRTAPDAVKVVRSGDRIYIGTASSIATAWWKPCMSAVRSWRTW